MAISALELYIDSGRYGSTHGLHLQKNLFCKYYVNVVFEAKLSIVLKKIKYVLVVVGSEDIQILWFSIGNGNFAYRLESLFIQRFGIKFAQANHGDPVRRLGTPFKSMLVFYSYKCGIIKEAIKKYATIFYLILVQID